MSTNQPNAIPVGKPIPGAQKPAQVPVPSISDADKNKLKKQAFVYLPKQLNTIPAQKQILEMLAAVIAPMRVCLEKAYRETFPNAQSGVLPVNQAVAQCAYEVNTIAGMIVLENLPLQQETREDLLKAWVVLDYYSYILKPEFSQNIRNLQNHLARYLLNTMQQSAPVRNSQPVPEVPGLPPLSASEQTIADLAPKPMQNKTVAQAFDEEFTVSRTSKRKPILPIMLSVLLIAALAVGGWFYMEKLSPVAKAEQAIDAIGTVTLESEEVLFAAETLFDQLPEHKRGKVENKQALLDARTEYDRLTAAVQKAVDAINAIGTVSENSGDAIQKAWAAYDALKADDLTGYVANEYSVLKKADEEYNTICIRNLLASAQEEQNNGNYQKAKELYHSLVSQYPEDDSVSVANTGIMNCSVKLAEAELKNSNLEAAAKLLDEVSSLCSPTDEYTKAKESLTQRLKQIRPHNGKIFRTKIDWGYGKLTLEATKEQDALFKVVSTTDESKFILIYVQAGNTAEARLKDGTYYVKYTTGDNWYGEDSKFGADAPFYKSTTTYSYTTKIEGNWIYYYAREASLIETSADYFIGTTIQASEF